MKKIRLNTVRIKKKLYLKVPSTIEEAYNLNENNTVEVSLYNQEDKEQTKLWPVHPEDLSSIKFFISKDVYTMNMYNRIYVPEKHRFFFPVVNKDFLLNTNSGTIKTHISSNGYLNKGLRYWFSLNGPLMNDDLVTILLIDEDKLIYEMDYKKNENNSL